MKPVSSAYLVFNSLSGIHGWPSRYISKEVGLQKSGVDSTTTRDIKWR